VKDGEAGAEDVLARNFRREQEEDEGGQGRGRGEGENR